MLQRPWVFAAALSLLACLSTRTLSTAAQEAAVTPAERKQADEWFRANDWDRAAGAYESIVQREPKNAVALARLGQVRHTQGQYDLAIAAYQRSVEVQSNPNVLYNLACSHARAQRVDDAFQWLHRALSAGFAQMSLIASDADLASLRDHARFAACTLRAQTNAFPCMTAPHARDFDFWIGEWIVRDTAGTQVGTSSIQLILGQCVILENWTDGTGRGGKSINVFHRDKQKWQQTWVDDRGNVIEFVNGELVAGAMRFEAESVQQDGTKHKRRLTFFPLAPDRVRQFSEGSNDAGKTWFVEYDFFYSRKQP